MLHPAPTGLVSRVFLALQAKATEKKKKENFKRRQTIFPFQGVDFRRLKRGEQESSNDWIEARRVRQPLNCRLTSRDRRSEIVKARL